MNKFAKHISTRCTSFLNPPKPESIWPIHKSQGSEVCQHGPDSSSLIYMPFHTARDQISPTPLLRPVHQWPQWSPSHRSGHQRGPFERYPGTQSHPWKSSFRQSSVLTPLCDWYMIHGIFCDDIPDLPKTNPQPTSTQNSDCKKTSTVVFCFPSNRPMFQCRSRRACHGKNSAGNRISNCQVLRIWFQGKAVQRR